MSRQQQLDELLVRWAELREQGEVRSAKELCSDCPDLEIELADSIQTLERLDWLDGELVDDDATSRRDRAPASISSCDSTESQASSECCHRDQREVMRMPLQLGEYTLLEMIGRGGMGQVYRAIHRRMEREVAVKIVREGALASPKAVERFHREVKAAAKLDHPNIVTAYDAGEERGIQYLVMEFIEGKDLARYVQKHGPLTIDHAIDCITQAARGLCYAHGQGFVHRDVKPANLLLTTEGTIKILDMGLARIQITDSPELFDPGPEGSADTQVSDSLTQTGSVHGTVAYMAPEQMEDAKHTDPRAEVYSLGCTFYFLLTGRTLPRQGLASSVRDERLDVTTEVEAVLCKMVAREPTDRCQSMEEVLAALEPHSKETESSANHPSRRGKRIAAQFACAAFAAMIMSWVGFEGKSWLDAVAMENRLLNAPMRDLPGIVSKLAPHRRWLDPRLERALATAEARGHDRVHLRAALALSAVDSTHNEYLFERMLVADPDELLAIRSILSPYQDELAERLWAELDSEKASQQRRLRAACVLAEYAPQSRRWHEVCDDVTAILVTESPEYLLRWIDCLAPVHREFIAPLSEALQREGRLDAPESLRLAEALATVAADQPEVLVDLLLDAKREYFVVFERALAAHREAAIRLLRNALDKPETADVGDKITLAKRKANAGVALISLGEVEAAWPRLAQSENPECRSFMIHRLGPFGVDPVHMIERLDVEPNTSVRRALILSLAEFPEDKISHPQRAELVDKLLDWYRHDPDSGIHGAVEWLLERWQQHARLDEVRRQLSAEAIQSSKNWYVTSEGQTMALVRAPVEFQIGSCEDEPGRDENEGPIHTTIPYSFALAAREVTAEEFQRFSAEHLEVPSYAPSNHEPEADSPHCYGALRTSMAYCRWLSEREAIPEEEMCYPPIADILTKPRPLEEFRQRVGYRLPTEEEWEYACRAGTSTSRYYGDADELLGEYVSYKVGVRQLMAGVLKPNDLGLFDLLGSVQEFCHGSVALDDGSIRPYIMLRGGSFRHNPESLRSAYRSERHERTRPVSLGFRIARTIPASWNPPGE